MSECVYACVPTMHIVKYRYHMRFVHTIREFMAQTSPVKLRTFYMSLSFGKAPPLSLSFCHCMGMWKTPSTVSTALRSHQIPPYTCCIFYRLVRICAALCWARCYLQYVGGGCCSRSSCNMCEYVLCGILWCFQHVPRARYLNLPLKTEQRWG